MQKIKNQFRQGDVLVNRIAMIPTGAKALKSGQITLAEGEVTGHAHRIKASRKITAFLDGEQLYLEVRAPVVLEHEEHAPLTIEPGSYEVRRQVEVWMDEVRAVAD